jgi:hypothetical protein
VSYLYGVHLIEQFRLLLAFSCARLVLIGTNQTLELIKSSFQQSASASPILLRTKYLLRTNYCQTYTSLTLITIVKCNETFLVGCKAHPRLWPSFTAGEGPGQHATHSFPCRR